MKHCISLVSAAVVGLAAFAPALIAPSSVAAAPITQFAVPPHDPVCVASFATLQHLSWLLVCQKTVPIAQMGVAVTQAQTANCNTYSYWNFGPKVDTTVDRARGTATVKYTCGHVEG